MKISPVGNELLRADGRTDGHIDVALLIVSNRSVANAPNKMLVTVFLETHATYCFKRIWNLQEEELDSKVPN